VAADDDVTNGELHRRLSAIEGDMRGVQTSLMEIKTTLAGQGVKVGVVWSALGVAGAAMVTSLAAIVMGQQ
jgi:hypothetical protein